MRAIDPVAMFRPSMAPCRSGGVARLIMAEMLGMASDMPQAPTAMTIGNDPSLDDRHVRAPMIEAEGREPGDGRQDLQTSDPPNSSIPIASTRVSPNRAPAAPSGSPGSPPRRCRRS
jgi:hypothetical protein